MAKRTEITIYDLAKEAGVSVATASRALSDTPNTSSVKQRRVIELAEKYSFHPNMLARNFFSGKSRTLCILLPEITNPFYSEMFSAADEEAALHGCSLVLCRLPADSAGMPNLYERMISRRYEGAIIAGGIVEKPQGKALELLHQLQSYMPIAIISAPISGLDCTYIVTDMVGGMRISVRYLYGLGHRRIALLGGDSTNSSSMERKNGYLLEMESLGLTDEVQYHQAAGYTPAGGETGVQQLLGSIDRASWPTAIIAINDLVALGALRQLNRMGLRVPEDVSLIGCDNQFFAAFTNPPLTTLDLKAGELGRMAVASLMQTPRGDAPCVCQTRDAALIVRESCGVKLDRQGQGVSPLASPSRG